MDEAIITITIKKTETGYNSNCQIVGLEEALAACILIDIGRDILARLVAVHEHSHSHELTEETQPNGH